MQKRVLLFFLFCYAITYSQEIISTKNAPKKDLKVGLVLSGGGAKGLAHIGAIKVIEEAGIRVDYVGGTSAGAMVGALYASGYNAKEIDSILRSYDYKKLVQNVNSRELYSFYQKENSEKYTLSLPVKNNSIGLPVALSRGQNMLNELSKLTKHVHGINDFKKLPIPFYCVATDLETGEQIILEDGFLPQAIRASGAFPSVFEPVEINGRSLVDGGITNNFPIDIMVNKDVDIIIGIDIQGKLDKKELLDSAPKVVMQIVSFQMYDDNKDKIDKTDIHIKPDMKDYSVVSFDKMDEIITEGELATRKEMDYLVAIASQQTKKPLQIRDKLITYKNKYLKIKKVHINGNDHYTRNYVLSKLLLGKNKKDSISYDEFNRNVNSLATTQNFKSIDYVIKPNGDDSSIVQFNLKENDVNKFVQLGVHYDDLYKTSVLLNFTGKHLLTNNDILSTDFIVGDNLRYSLNYLIDNGFHWRFGVSHRYNSFRRSYYLEPDEDAPVTFSNSIPIKYNDFSTKLYFQTKFEERFAFNGGLKHQYLNINTTILNNSVNEKFYFDKSNYYGAFAEIILDTRDAKNFTTKGWYFNTQYSTYLNRESDIATDFTPFSQIQLELKYTKTFWNKLTAELDIHSGVTLGVAPQSFDYSLGGYNKNFINNLIPFYGYDVADLQDDGFFKTGLSLRYNFIKGHYLLGTVNTFAPSNLLYNTDDPSEISELKDGYAIGYGMKSLIGPIEIRYAGSSNHEKKYWYFNIGFWF